MDEGVDRRDPADETITVTDAADERLDDYRLLNDQATRRTIEGDEFFIVEGYVGIDRLIASGHTVRSVLLAPSRVPRFRPHIAGLLQHGVPIYVAERSVFAAAVGFDLHRGVVASANRRALPSVADVASTTSRIAVLEGLNDAENLGAIARAARAFGVEALVIDPTCTDPYSRRTVRVSMGEVLALPIARADGPLAHGPLAVLHDHGFTTWAMTPHPAADDLWSVSAPGCIPDRVAVLFGAEGPGLTSATLTAASAQIRIPIASDVDSLNVGHSAAVTFAALSRR